MNMKKLMAGIAASALAVTSLATAASAEVVELYKVKPQPVTKYNTYTVTQSLPDDIYIDKNVEIGKDVISTNLVPGDFYTIEGMKSDCQVLITDVTISGYHVIRLDNTDNEAGTIATKKAVLTTAVEADKDNGLIAPDTLLEDIKVSYTMKVYVKGTLTSENVNSFEWVKLGKDYYYWDKDTDYSADVLGNVKSYNEGNKFTYPTLTVEPGLRTQLNNKIVTDDGSVDNKIDLNVTPTLSDSDSVTSAYAGGLNVFFSTEVPTVGTFYGYDGHYYGTSYWDYEVAGSVGFKRLDNAEIADLQALNGNLTITVSFLKKATKDYEFEAFTDLTCWHQNLPASRVAPYTAKLAKGEDSFTFEVPAIDFFDANFKNDTASGFLRYLAIDYAKTYDVYAGDITEILITYNSEDVTGTPISGGNTNNNQVISVTAGSGEYTVKVTGTVAAIYGDADDLTVNNKITDNSISYVLDLTKNGAASQLTGEVTLQLSIPKDWQGKTIKDNQVTHKHRDGSSEKLDILNDYKADGYAVVKTSQFSEFEMEFEDDENGDTNTPGDDNNGDNTPADDNNGGDNGAAGDNGNTNAPTDDKNAPTGVVIAVIPALVAAAGVVISKKRK